MAEISRLCCNQGAPALQARPMQHLLVFSHLMAVAVYIGATVMLAIMVDTIGRQAADAVARRRRFAEIFRVYNPLTIGALGVIVMTGAWSLTPYKQALGAGYYAHVGSALVSKLALAFVLINMATYVSFGICHRVVRADQGALPITDAGLAKTLARLRASLWLTAIVAAVTFWVGAGMNAPVVGG